MRRRYRVFGATLAAFAVALTIGVLPNVGGGGAGVTCTTTITGGSLSTAMSTAAAGSTVCLNAGSYTYTASTITKASMVTATPNNGVSRASVSVAYVDVRDSTNLRFDNLIVDGGVMGWPGNAVAHNIEFKNVIFTSGMCIQQDGGTAASQSGLGLLVEASTFANIAFPGGCGNEGRLTINGRGSAKPNGFDLGIVVRNNVFSGGTPSACTDGIQLTGDATGATIVGNTFQNIKQGSCTEHVDPIQFNGGRYATIDGNYFAPGNSTGLLMGDCNQSPLIVKNNVFHYDGEYQDQIVAGGSVGDVFEHNVLADGATLRMGQVNACGQSSGNTIRNNVLTGGMRFTTCNGGPECNGTQANSCSGCTFANNLVPSGGGSITQTGGFTGNPTYIGGATPSTWGGFGLAAASLGYLGATDGLSVGIN